MKSNAHFLKNMTKTRFLSESEPDYNYLLNSQPIFSPRKGKHDPDACTQSQKMTDFVKKAHFAYFIKFFVIKLSI